MNKGYNKFNSYNSSGSASNVSSNAGGNYDPNGSKGSTAEKYKTTSIETADQGKLIVELYKGAIKFMKMGRKYIEEKDIMGANECLIRSQQIISELMNTLNFEEGGEVAANLEALYDYMLRELVQANLKKDAERVKNVEDMMLELLNSWQEAAKKARKEKRRQEKVAIGMEG